MSSANIFASAEPEFSNPSTIRCCNGAHPFGKSLINYQENGFKTGTISCANALGRVLPYRSDHFRKLTIVALCSILKLLFLQDRLILMPGGFS
jgi:hypothetical protein